MQTGIHAQSLLLPEEKLEDLQTLIAEYYRFHTPRTPAARSCVDALIRAEWFSRRLARIDTQILAHEVQTLSRPDPGCTEGQGFSHCRISMQRIQQRITATDRLYHRNLRVFQLLQPETPPEPTPEPTPEPPEPQLSTVQPPETKPQTQQMGSFRKTTPILPNGHPADPQDCPNCRTLGYHSPSCHYDHRRAPV